MGAVMFGMAALGYAQDRLSFTAIFGGGFGLVFLMFGVLRMASERSPRPDE
ncbi:hypothetical protein FTUN_2783 [Frigoriglobus tundricola]|uniref:Uncharacterized protein n=1 Tax=Frigoriglobus tundricola TaxID=2774151 RepID=A0A6M5YPS1_9BACT|nr:hypothetical protein FTUN_2783 [Frigoriglobus tundricola]